MRYYEIHSWDEVPAIGSGRRYVLAHEGRVWVRLLTPTLRSARISRDKWRQISKHEIPLTPERCRALMRTMREWRPHRPRTALVKQTETALRELRANPAPSGSGAQRRPPRSRKEAVT